MLRLSPLLLVAALGVPSAYAQASATNRAEVLDAEGSRLLRERKLVDACPKLAESFRQEPGTGVLLRLALCQELSGKRATAWAFYLDAADRARAAEEPNLVELAERRAAALEARLSRLTVQLDPSAQQARHVQVSRNGTPVEPTALGAALPIDPGPHVIEATAPGRKRFLGTIVVSERPESYTITVTLPFEEVASRVPSGEDVPRAEPSIWSTQRSLALVAGGGGVAGLAVGTVFGLHAGSQMRDARAGCTEGKSRCPPEALALQDEARDSALASNIAFAVGAAGLASGFVLWLTDRRPTHHARNLRLRAAPLAAPGTAGIQAVGTW